MLWTLERKGSAIDFMMMEFVNSRETSSPKFFFLMNPGPTIPLLSGAFCAGL
jgi:hypothetical protein